MRRPADQALPLGRRRVTRADGGLDGGELDTHPASRRRDPWERHLQVAIDVVVERLKWRDVQDLYSARQRVLAPEAIEASQERRQRLAGAGGGENERVPSRGDGRPALMLGLGR